MVTPSALSQLVWMIFLKILDDTEEELELMTDGYVPAIPEKYQWRKWAGNEGIDRRAA